LKVLPSSPGSLPFFRGEHALHHLTPIEGATARVNSVLMYGERPDIRLNDLASEDFYGRTSNCVGRTSNTPFATEWGVARAATGPGAKRMISRMTDRSEDTSGPDRIFVGRRIVAMDGSEPEAFVVAAGLVTATGSYTDLRTRHPDAERVDLDGAMVLPGFNDAHCHVSQAALQRVRVDVGGLRSTADVVELLKARARHTPVGEWVVGQGLDEHLLDATIDRATLDQVSGDRPVLIMQYTFHRAVVNTAALAALGYRDESDAPPGGQLMTDPAGHLNGWLLERAWLDPWLPGREADTVVGAGPVGAQVTALRQVHHELHRVGITSYCDAIVTPLEERMFRAAQRSGTLTPRVNMLIWHSYADLNSPWPAPGTGHLRTAGIKMMIDGALSGGTCLCQDPYPSATGQDNGLQILTDDEFTRLFVAANRVGARVAVHANGDAAIAKVLDHVERSTRPGLRHRVEHCSMLPDTLLNRIAELGVIPVPFGPFVHLFGQQILDFYGPERAETICAHRSLLERGIPAGGSSDYPIVPIDPLLAIQSMVTRQTTGGLLVGPSQRVSPLQAAWIYTAGSAFATGEEGFKGQLTPGQVADFVTLDQDLTTTDPASLSTVRPTSTWVGGTCVWRR
jgi:predicted amidohydrolase YtcJ